MLGAPALRLEGARNADGEEPVVSVAALQFHGFGIINSVQDGHPASCRMSA